MFQQVCFTFKIVNLNPYQGEAVAYFVEKKMVVFVSILTSFGKWLIYQSMPLVSNVTCNIISQIVIVLSVSSSQQIVPYNSASSAKSLTVEFRPSGLNSTVRVASTIRYFISE